MWDMLCMITRIYMTAALNLTSADTFYRYRCTYNYFFLKQNLSVIEFRLKKKVCKRRGKRKLLGSLEKGAIKVEKKSYWMKIDFHY